MQSNFDLPAYVQAVYDNIAHIRADIERIKNHVEALQAVAGQVGILISELNNVKKDVEGLNKDIDMISKDFALCQQASIRKGGSDDKDLALIKQEWQHETDEKRKKANRKWAIFVLLIAALFSFLSSIVVLVIEKRISHKTQTQIEQTK